VYSAGSTDVKYSSGILDVCLVMGRTHVVKGSLKFVFFQ
jgi:hypothetical protein